MACRICRFGDYGSAVPVSCKEKACGCEIAEEHNVGDVAAIRDCQRASRLIAVLGVSQRGVIAEGKPNEIDLILRTKTCNCAGKGRGVVEKQGPARTGES